MKHDFSYDYITCERCEKTINILNRIYTLTQLIFKLEYHKKQDRDKYNFIAKEILVTGGIGCLFSLYNSIIEKTSTDVMVLKAKPKRHFLSCKHKLAH